MDTLYPGEIDEIGRVKIPQDILDIIKSPLEVEMKVVDNQIVLSLSVNDGCKICGSKKRIKNIMGTNLCEECITALTNNELMASKLKKFPFNSQIIDEQGKIYIPLNVREKLNMDYKQPIVVYMEEDNDIPSECDFEESENDNILIKGNSEHPEVWIKNRKIFIKPIIPKCFLCKSESNICKIGDNHICLSCWGRFGQNKIEE